MKIAKNIFFFFKVLCGSPALRKLFRRLKALFWYLKDLRAYKKQQKTCNNLFPVNLYYPCLLDKTDSSGSVGGHYFWQDLLVARKIYANKPQKHVDIGSQIAGFIAHVCVFREIEVFDIRPLNSNIKNVKFTQADLMADDFSLNNYTDSVSCLHTIEHMGLGRYGDKIDVNGHLKCLANIYKMLLLGGQFYFSVPIGKQCTAFNAHRIFSLDYLLNIFKDQYNIQSFSYVDDKGDFFENAELTLENVNTSFNCLYGCGIFELIKK
ncbi:MAG: DUF268 domain-containing protein [Prevotellaceae bacterium]|jgi:hypothetical protein|nr:DUF268 domain-containing protein [Prevotellaceae bacterium]